MKSSNLPLGGGIIGDIHDLRRFQHEGQMWNFSVVVESVFILNDGGENSKAPSECNSFLHLSQIGKIILIMDLLYTPCIEVFLIYIFEWVKDIL